MISGQDNHQNLSIHQLQDESTVRKKDNTFEPNRNTEKADEMHTEKYEQFNTQ